MTFSFRWHLLLLLRQVGVRAMKIVVAPSGYKECLDADLVATAIANGVRRACPDARITELPLVDGGEGTALALGRLTQGEARKLTVTGPVGEPVEAHFVLLGGRNPPVAAIDLASAAGLKLVPRDRRDPGATTSRGVGELIAAAIDAGARHIVLGCGDSGVNDGGAGLVQALGVRLLGPDGRDVPVGGAGLAELERIDLSGLDPRVRETRIEVACNLKNILCGENGVARIFGPQKGATPEEVEALAAALERFAAVVQRDLGLDVRTMPGGGASGGVGAGVHALLGAELCSRFDVLLPFFGLDEALQGAELVLTAEGGIDFKSARGKIPSEVGSRASALGIPVIALAGTIGERAEIVHDHGVHAYFSTTIAPETLEEAIEHAEAEVAITAENVMRTFLLGFHAAMRRIAGTGTSLKIGV